MKTLFSVLLKIFLTIVVLVCVGMLVLGYYANPERIKPLVITHVKQEYNRTLEVGSITWRVFPRLGISLGNIRLSNGPAFGTGTFAAFKDISVFVDTLSLLQGKINVKTMRVASPVANLQTDKTGNSNWNDLMKPSSSASPQAAPSQAQSANSPSSMMDNFEFNIDSVEIVDGSFDYVDEKTGEKMKMTKLNFKSTDVALNKDFPVKLSFNLDSNAPALIADVNAQATMRVAAKNNRYDLSALTLTGDVSIPSLQAQGIKISALKSELMVKDNNISLPSITANLYGGTFSGAANINAKQEPADVQVQYNLRGTDIASLLKDLNGKSSFTGKLNMKGDLRFRSFTEKKQMMQTLNGSANMNIDKGALQGIDLAYWYSVRNNLLAQAKVGMVQSVPARSNTGQTEFIQARANFIIDRGLMTNKDFIVYNSSIYGAGAGNVDLVQEQINYRFQIQGVRMSSAGASPVGQVVPLQITGPLSNPKMGVDIGNVVKEAVVQTVGSQLMKALSR